MAASTLQLPERDFDGYIFDCDGTLVDSMPLHFVAWVESLRRHDAPYVNLFTEEYFYSQAGISEADTVRNLNVQYDAQIDAESVVRVKMDLFYQEMDSIREVGPVAEIARRLHGKKPIAVASGSEEITVRRCLAATGLLPLFDIIITPKDVKHGKPAPDMFLLAAERMGVVPEKCVVFEDGNSGIVGARAAGMEVVFVPQGLSRA
jgi:beta-phosphoglucomutase family hydrolase